MIDGGGKQKMKNPLDYICPRCTGLIPCAEQWGEYQGALSRHTRNDEEPLWICSDCGTEEAMEEHFGGGLTPRDEYPISHDSAITRVFKRITVVERHNDGSGESGIWLDKGS